ncbi:Curli production assembly/transport component CsgG [Herbaspirillum sp. YR522]|nr:Curli production assembly/transport component CsgG [Herbaspirillum sp. YR522]
MTTMMGERSLQESGELRNRSNFGKGKMVAADYGLSPSITFTNNNAGGAGASVAGFIPGGFGSAIGALAGSMNSKEASTLLTVVDNRSGVQLAAAEGSATSMDFGALGRLIGNSSGGSLGGYSNTAEGKVIVAAFTDSYNNVVRAIRNYKQQTVAGGLGTGGNLSVQDDNDAPAPATKKTTRKKKK